MRQRSDVCGMCPSLYGFCVGSVDGIACEIASSMPAACTVTVLTLLRHTYHKTLTHQCSWGK
jgi:hypothetical protein